MIRLSKRDVSLEYIHDLCDRVKMKATGANAHLIGVNSNILGNYGELKAKGRNTVISEEDALNIINAMESFLINGKIDLLKSADKNRQNKNEQERKLKLKNILEKFLGDLSFKEKDFDFPNGSHYVSGKTFYEFKYNINDRRILLDENGIPCNKYSYLPIKKEDAFRELEIN